MFYMHSNLRNLLLIISGEALYTNYEYLHSSINCKCIFSVFNCVSRSSLKGKNKIQYLYETFLMSKMAQVCSKSHFYLKALECARQ